MVVGIKDAVKLIGISIIVCCAVLVCTLFTNFNFDIVQVEDMVLTEQGMVLYQAQLFTSKVVCLICGGCLLATSIVMLLFYIKHYIDTHKKELGILKALGYSNWRVAVHFWVFGTSVLIGSAVGSAGAFLLMPTFYKVQNEDHILPEIMMHFHFPVLLYYVILPSIAFAILAILYAVYKLKRPVMSLLKEDMQSSVKTKKHKKNSKQEDTEKRAKRKEKQDSRTFVTDLRKSTLRSKKTLSFFILFASFCFSTMTQMFACMDELASVMMGVMILMIGIVLACTTLLLAITTVIKGNTKTIAMMRVFGYSQKECSKSLLGGYRPLSYIGFAVGTVYQYVLIRLIVDIIFKDMEGIPAYQFDVSTMCISLICFVVFYELVMFRYSEKIKQISIKEIMSE